MPGPELLSPAGDPACVAAAVQNGADAVYLGLKRGSARAAACNFTWQDLEEALRYAHIRGCRVYLALNTLQTDAELSDATEDALRASEMGVNALIVQDMGLARQLLRLRRDGVLPPAVALHASTQMSICTPDGARFLREQGFDRLITARELSIAELGRLCREKLPIECFVHGALCMSLSGQCLLSSYLGGANGSRSGNRGACAQPCRLPYRLLTPCREDRGRTGPDAAPCHLLSPTDFCALPLLDRLVACGVASLKIEGRLKSAAYTALTTAKYRKALDRIADGTFDAYKNGPEMREDLEELALLFSRGAFTHGYLTGPLPVQAVTRRNPGRKGPAVGTATELPAPLSGPNRLPQTVRLYTVTAACTGRTPQPGDGITILDAEEKLCAGGTVNAVAPCRDGRHRLTFAGRIANAAPSMPLTLHLTYCKALEAAVAASFAPGRERPRVPVSFSLTLEPGTHASLTVRDGDGHCVTVKSESMTEQAHDPSLQEALWRRQMQKTMNTPYFTEEITVDVRGLPFLRVAKFNALRRAALESLSACRASEPTRGHHAQADTSTAPAIPAAPASPAASPIPDGAYALYFFRAADLLSSDVRTWRHPAHGTAPLLLYVPLETWNDPSAAEALRRAADTCGAKLIAAFPLLPFRQGDRFQTALARAAAQADGLQITYPDDLIAVRSCLEQNPQLLLCGDSSLNVTNTATARFYAEQGVRILTLSPEAVRSGALPEPVENVTYEWIAQGPLPLLRTRHCVIATDRYHCGACTDAATGRAVYALQDSRGAVYPILAQADACQNILLSPGPFPVNGTAMPPHTIRRIQIFHEGAV